MSKSVSGAWQMAWAGSMASSALTVQGERPCYRPAGPLHPICRLQTPRSEMLKEDSSCPCPRLNKHQYLFITFHSKVTTVLLLALLQLVCHFLAKDLMYCRCKNTTKQKIIAGDMKSNSYKNTITKEINAAQNVKYIAALQIY